MEPNKTQSMTRDERRNQSKLPLIRTVIIWLIFIAGSAWLLLSDLQVVPRLDIVDHYYWLLLIIFILLTSGKPLNRSK